MGNEEKGKWGNEEMETGVQNSADKTALFSQLVVWLTVCSIEHIECAVGWQGKEGHDTTGVRYGSSSDDRISWSPAFPSQN